MPDYEFTQQNTVKSVTYYRCNKQRSKLPCKASVKVTASEVDLNNAKRPSHNHKPDKENFQKENLDMREILKLHLSENGIFSNTKPESKKLIELKIKDSYYSDSVKEILGKHLTDYQDFVSRKTLESSSQRRSNAKK